MKIKICGITKLEDALFSIQNGADAIGFVFHKASPRYINPTQARDIIASLPPFIHKVGLFTNHSFDEVNDIMDTAKLSLAQLHKEVNQSFLDKLKHPFIEVARIKSKIDLEKLSTQRYYLADSFVDGFGGEGKRLDLDIFNNLDCSKLILAGGLNSTNLREIKNLNFYGVDVSSGVESTKGVKNHTKIREFIEIAKNITSTHKTI